MTKDEMAGSYQQLDGREFEWTPGVGDGQGGLACCSSWGHKELNTTEQLKTHNISLISLCVHFSSVTQSCPTLCDPMNYSTPGFPILHYLLELAQTTYGLVTVKRLHKNII